MKRDEAPKISWVCNPPYIKFDKRVAENWENKLESFSKITNFFFNFLTRL